MDKQPDALLHVVGVTYKTNGAYVHLSNGGLIFRRYIVIEGCHHIAWINSERLYKANEFRFATS